MIAKLYGTGYAQQVALSEEYDWQSSSKFARAALADQQIPEIGIDSLGTWNLDRTEGDTSHWDVVVEGKLKVTADECAHRVEAALSAAKWTRVASPASSGARRTSHWRFTGSDGKPWRATIIFERDGGAADQVKASLSIVRA